MIQDDASSWFASQNQPIQDFEAPPAPEAEPLNPEPAFDPDRPFADAPTVTDEDVRNVTNMRLAQQPTAELIVGVMDVILPLALVLLIKGTDKNDIKLEPPGQATLATKTSRHPPASCSSSPSSPSTEAKSSPPSPTAASATKSAASRQNWRSSRPPTPSSSSSWPSPARKETRNEQLLTAFDLRKKKGCSV